MMPFIFVFMRREKAEVIYRELNVAVEEIYTEYIYIYTLVPIYCKAYRTKLNMVNMAFFKTFNMKTKSD